MTAHAWVEFVVSMGVLLLLAWALGEALAVVLTRNVTAFEKKLIGDDQEMTWSRYAQAVVLFNVIGVVAVYVIARLQHLLPFNPSGLGAVDPNVAFNTAISFATNTNWQAYSGETTLSHFTQMVALTTQNFVSAATGVAVLLAVMRGLSRAQSKTVGNFWVDLTRVTLVLVPLALVVALILIATGVPQTLLGTIDGASVGPVASQVAIKQLGTNGGGFFNVNSAHPLENPSPASNTIEWLALLLIPAALCFTFGRIVGERRQGLALLAAMLVIFVPLTVLGLVAEQNGVPALVELGVDPSAGHLEGKEVRFGVTSSVLWSTATTAASNGSVNAMHDSFTPLASLGPMVLMQLGEIVFGGAGSGLYGMLLYVIVAVFIAGLMVGRTPEYLGKKIEAREMKMAALGILIPSMAVLIGTALATKLATDSLGNPGAHGFSELLYAFSSGANNNGSAFAGLTVNGTFFSVAIGVCMWLGRFWVIIPVLAIAGSLAERKKIPPSAGTLPTHTPLFVGLLAITIVLVGALTFVPALALGPIVEHLQMIGVKS